MRIVLLEPEIPQNTGSIARLAAATDTALDLIGPLGFSLEDRYLKRAGLDYWPFVQLRVYESWRDYLDRSVKAGSGTPRIVAFSARASQPYTRCRFSSDDLLLFGKETKGLPRAILNELSESLYTIPIQNKGVRSLNLSNAVSIIVYEARRQLGLLD